MAQDWFSSGVNAMSNVFGSSAFNKSNPFAGQSSFNQANPFTRAMSFNQANPFTQASSFSSRGSLGSGFKQDYGNPLTIFENNSNRRLAEMMQQYQQTPMYGGTGQSLGTAIASGATFANGNLDNASNYINAASAKYGVPANLIKAMIARESSGDWARDGSRYTYLASRGENILPYVGIMDSTARSWGYDPKQLVGNQGLQIEAMANGLARLYSRVGAQYGWDGVIATYYSGDPTAKSTPGDSTQYGTTSQYLSQVKGWWQQLDSASGSTGTYSMNGAGGGYGSGWTSAWQGDFAITQEFGNTAFSQTAQGQAWYGYGSSVGVQGHPGLDVGMPAGTKLYTPTGGTVVTAGGSGYYRDVSGNRPGTGELRIQMDNGDILILGHMGSIALTPGQRVNAGTYVGTSGSFNGDHLHYEVRKATPGATSSGYTAVDPRQYFNGVSLTQQGGIPLGSQTSNGLWWKQSLSSLFRS